MAKGYCIARLDITNPEAYQRYRALNGAVFEKFGARFLVRGPAGYVAMGTSRAHNVVIEFESYETALACFHSPEYQAAKVHLQEAGVIDLVIVPGYEA